jgi:hypothetical protein
MTCEKYGFYHDVIDDLSGDKTSDNSVHGWLFSCAPAVGGCGSSRMRRGKPSVHLARTLVYRAALEQAEKTNAPDPTILVTSLLGATQYQPGG